MPIAGLVTTGGNVSTTTPAEFCYTGVMENLYADSQAPIDLADLDPGAIRMIRSESNSLGQPGAPPNFRMNTIPRSIDILDAGIYLIPCIHTDGWSSKTAFTSYLADWIDALDANVDNPPLWWEIGNEPSTGGTTAQIRAKYLDYMTDASTVLDARGKKLILAAITGTAGGTTAMLEDIHDAVSSAAFSQIDGVAIHPYVVDGSGTDSYDSVAGYRVLFDSTTGDGYTHELQGKPIFITELGWSCAVRADGAQHGDWAGQVPEMLTTNVSITQAQQASYISNSFGQIISHRAKSDLYLKAITYFAYHDYGLPNENWDRHCGLVDIAQGKRQSYNTIKNYQRSFSIAA